MLDVALLRVDKRHADHLHAGAEISTGGHVIAHLHRAPLFCEGPDPLLRRQAYVIVVRHNNFGYVLANTTGTLQRPKQLV